MSKALVSRKNNLVRKSNPLSVGMSDKTLLIIGAVLVIGLILWFVIKRRQTPVAQYQNEESWEVSYNSDGMPTKIVIHRDATQK